MHMTLEGNEPIDADADYAEILRTIDNTSKDLDRIIVAISVMEPGMVDHLSTICRRHQVKLSVLSPLRGRTGPMPRISQVADLPVLECNTWDIPRSTGLIKRGIDLIAATGALVALAPLFPFVTAAILLDSRGPVIYRQRRVGQNGTPFWIYKLRTMHSDAEQRLGELVSFESLVDPMFKLRSDPRITRVGRVLRRFSIDELPQLVNVLRGEMSVVGPRPEQVELVERYRPEHRFRLSVKPGMTGPMQVFGRGELTFSERLAVELDYVENLSPSRDLKILIQTLPAIVRGTGAF
jgi:lipopolysaccharide/colanic/teichoic acid biosynthesis glycosyltransferase